MTAAVLDPDLPIIDAHHHFYPYKHPALPHGRYLINDMEADLASGHNVIATVYVECHFMQWRHGPARMRPVGEALYVDTMARLAESGLFGPTRICAGFVGAADLTLGDAVGEVLDALEEASGHRLRSIRAPANWDADPRVNTGTRPMAPPGLMAEPRFRAGVAQVARHGLVFDAWCYHPQLHEVADLAGAFPHLVFVTNHCGGLLRIGPYDSPETHGHWMAQVTELARRPNVVMKLGGLSGKRSGFGYDTRPTRATAEELAADWRPWIEPLIELFGADRCLFESNFPVDIASADYRTLWNAFKLLAAGASEAEKLALFSGTAARVYRLG